MRTLRAAAAAIAVLLSLAGAGCERERERAPEPITSRPAASAPTAGGPSAPRPRFARRFIDITREASIRFRHVTGAYGEKLLPETLGAGAAFLDLDGDGVLDIFFVNSTRFSAGPPPDGDPPPACALYRGRGDGTFEDVTAAAGAGISLYGMGCAVADYDGDGDDDIYVTAVGENVLLCNDEGRLRDVTQAAGVAGGRWQDHEGESHPEWSTAAAWADFDLDGVLDLFVASYVEWTPETEIFTTLDGATKVFTTPERYRGLPCRLFKGRGDGTFEDASARAGLLDLEGKALGVALWDFDRNGLLDVVVANDTRPNFFLSNDRSGRFREEGLALGIAYDANGRARAGMGIDVAEGARDGVPLVAIGNFSDEPMSLYAWRGDAGFASLENSSGLRSATYEPLAFGVLFLDADLDGIEDLAVVNGHIEPEIHRFYEKQTHAQSAQLFQGLGDRTFRDVSGDAGAEFVRPRVARGLAAGDIDRDGDLDLLITTNGGAPALLRNDAAQASSDRNHYLRVRLAGAGRNTRALGARVRLSAGGATQTRFARTGSSYLSQSEPTLTFGLGAATAVDRLEVTWPGGATREYAVAGVDRMIEVREE